MDRRAGFVASVAALVLFAGPLVPVIHAAGIRFMIPVRLVHCSSVWSSMIWRIQPLCWRPFCSGILPKSEPACHGRFRIRSKTQTAHEHHLYTHCIAETHDLSSAFTGAAGSS